MKEQLIAIQFAKFILERCTISDDEQFNYYYGFNKVKLTAEELWKEFTKTLEL